MIEISIESRKKLNSNTEFAAQWAIAKLMPKIRRLKVNIIVKPLDKGLYGYCSRNLNRDYTIVLSSRLTQKQLFETLFHEMVHVRQFMRKTLRNEYGLWIWKDRINKEKYENQPWEIEACSYEKPMYKEFKEYLK